MPYRLPAPPPSVLLAALLACSLHALAADDIGGEIVIDDAGDGEILIDAGGDSETLGSEITIDGGNGPGDEISIGDDPAATGDEISIDDTPTPDDAGRASLFAHDDTFEIGLDEARLEYAHFPDSGSETENSFYAHLSMTANWQPNPTWEFQLSARADGYREDQDDSFTTVRGDYGDSFIRYRGDRAKITLGTQTVVWGRMDELPLSDRVSTADLSRLILDDLEDRRRSNPMLRVEAPMAGGNLDLVWLYDFRAAELPARDSVWYPVDTRLGRLPGIDRNDLPAALVRNAQVRNNEPEGDAGIAARFTRAQSFADIGFTAGRVRQSVPYFKATAPGRLEAEYPRSWVVGADAAINAGGALWRTEVVYLSDSPVTRSDFRYTTTPAVQWGAGVEMHPGDGDSRVNLQVIGTNLVDAPDVLDRTETYSINGEIEVPFARERWRLDIDFLFGIDEKDIYVNPEIAFLGWEPHEIYLAVHYLDGDEQSLGGFYEDNSTVTIGWRSKF